MRQPDSIDELLRESLINWALEDIHDGVKRATLEYMSKPNWLHFLYCEERVKTVKKVELPVYTPAQLLQPAVKKPLPEFEEEEWVKNLLKAIHYALKQAYHTRFPVKKWGMRRINTTGMYVLGPMNDFGEIFFKFKVGVKDKVVYWDLENHRGKIRPKGFEAVPRVILEVVKAQGMDFLIRKHSKGFGVMHYSGTSSKQALALLVALKEAEVGIGSDAHGGLWLQAGKKKRYRLAWEARDESGYWAIYAKTEKVRLGYFSTGEELTNCIQALHLVNVCPRNNPMSNQKKS